MSLNHFRQLPQLAPNFSMDPDSIVAKGQRLIEVERRVQDLIVETVKPEDASFETVLLPLARAENERMAGFGHLHFFNLAFSNQSKFKEAVKRAAAFFSEFHQYRKTCKKLYELVEAVKQKKEKLAPEYRLFLEKYQKLFEHDRFNLPATSEKPRSQVIRDELNDLVSKFGSTVNRQNQVIWLTPEELEGVPSDMMSALVQGSGENEGKLRLPLHHTKYGSVMRRATNGETRKRVLIAYENRCKENVETHKRIMILRDEAARLLGHSSHAEERLLDGTMLKTPNNVNKFLEEQRSRLAPKAEIQRAKLKTLKKAHVESRGESFDGRLYLWDWRFYTNQLLEHEYAIDNEKVKEYFPFEPTFMSMLKILAELFGLDFHAVVGEERDKVSSTGSGRDTIWHDTVQILSVWDGEAQGSGFRGWLYIDPFVRENKLAGTWTSSALPGFLREDGTRHYPMCAVLSNFEKPTARKPCLLSHVEVSSLFHELGHAIHSFVCETRFARFHGGPTVARDFGEAPGKILEHWVWVPSVLQSIGKHYSYLSDEYFETWKAESKGVDRPDERMSEAMVENLCRAASVSDALPKLISVFISMLDLLCHNPESHKAIEKMNITAECNRLRKKIIGLDGGEELGLGDEWSNYPSACSFIVSPYNAAYYGYYYSEILGYDMFYTAFQDNPLDVEVGLRYREQILKKGGSQDAMELVTAFLGREPNSKAFYRAFGVDE